MQAYSGEVVYIHEVVDSQKLKAKDQKQDQEPVRIRSRVRSL